MNLQKAMAWVTGVGTDDDQDAVDTLAAEVDRLNAELDRVRQDFEDQTYMLQQINEALAADHPAIAATIRQHPAARHLTIVTADTAAPCDQ